jgi:hypothetical protein
MIPLEEMTDEQFRLHTLEILKRELGDAGVARFLRVNQAGSGDYTRDRRKWLKGITVRQIADEMAGKKQTR